MIQSAESNLTRHPAQQIIRVFIDGHDITWLCTAFDTAGGWADLYHEELSGAAGRTIVERRYGRVSAYRRVDIFTN